MCPGDRVESSFLTRRAFLALGVGAFVVAAGSLVARHERRLVRRAVPLMGTIADIAVLHPDVGEAQAALDAAIAELRLVDRRMTWFTGTSDIGRVNRLAAAHPVAVSAETAYVIREALAWAYASGGAYDPGIGRVVRLWDVGNRRTPPPNDGIRRLAGREFYRALDLDTWRGRPVVRFADADVEVDLGGIAKGYGVDRAVEALRQRGIVHAIVNVGGDLYALGEAEAGEPWRVGIRSPEDSSRLAGQLAIRDAAVATSGDYLQYFRYQGRRYHHLLDPETAAPRRTSVRSVTVMADACLTADGAATAVFGMPPAPAERLLSARASGAQIVSRIGGNGTEISPRPDRARG